MKKTILILSLLFFANEILRAQGWQELGTGVNALNPNNTIWALCADTGGVIYAAGGFTDSPTISSGNFYVAKWNGTSWSEVGTGVNSLHANGPANAICVDASHNLYAAGSFTDTSGKYYVAKWDGTSWSEIGVGSNALKANSLINTICVDAVGNVYAAGMFTDSLADTVGHQYVAKWNGITWSEMGTGSSALNANAYIRSIIADASGNVYAAGDFYSGWYNCVAKWDGANWSVLGAGAGALTARAPIWGLCTTTDGAIYAAGWFDNASHHYYVAKWDGASWTELGSGSNALNANDGILAICSDSANNIYAGGDFSNPDGDVYVAKWNGTTWTELGTASNGLKANGAVFALCADSRNNTYAAGQFTDSVYPGGHPYVAEFLSATNVELISNNVGTVDIIPNPATNKITITSADNIRAVAICNLMEQTVISNEFTSQKAEVDISSLPAGVYFVKVNGTEVRKFVKQ